MTNTVGTFKEILLFAAVSHWLYHKTFEQRCWDSTSRPTRFSKIMMIMMVMGLFRKILFAFHNDFKWKKKTLILFYRSALPSSLPTSPLGAHQTTHWTRSLSSRPVSRWNFTPPHSYVHVSFSDPLRAYFSPLWNGMGLQLSLQPYICACVHVYIWASVSL